MATMTGFVHTLDCNDKPIEIIPIADLHIGDPACQMNVVKSLINDLSENDNRYTILIGDLMNTAMVLVVSKALMTAVIMNNGQSRKKSIKSLKSGSKSRKNLRKTQIQRY